MFDGQRNNFFRLHDNIQAVISYARSSIVNIDVIHFDITLFSLVVVIETKSQDEGGEWQQSNEI